MKAPFLPTVLILFSLPAMLFAAETITSAPALSETVQLTEFFVQPGKIVAGDPADFSLTVESTGSSVHPFKAEVAITDSSGAQVAQINFLDTAIAGGESQTLSKSWSTNGIPPGNYSALANVTEGNGTSRSLLAAFEILPPSSAGEAAITMQNGQKAPEKECGTAEICSPQGGCIDNYATQVCSLSACPEKRYYRVKSCAQLPQGSRQLEKGICSSYPFLCTGNQQGDWLFYFCLPGVLMGVLIAFFLLWKIREPKL